MSTENFESVRFFFLILFYFLQNFIFYQEPFRMPRIYPPGDMDFSHISINHAIFLRIGCRSCKSVDNQWDDFSPPSRPIQCKSMHLYTVLFNYRVSKKIAWLLKYEKVIICYFLTFLITTVWIRNIYLFWRFFGTHCRLLLIDGFCTFCIHCYSNNLLQTRVRAERGLARGDEMEWWERKVEIEER